MLLCKDCKYFRKEGENYLCVCPMLGQDYVFGEQVALDAYTCRTQSNFCGNSAQWFKLNDD